MNKYSYLYTRSLLEFDESSSKDPLTYQGQTQKFLDKMSIYKYVF